MSSGLFGVYPVFLLYCFRNPFGCCSCLSSVLSSESLLLYFVFFPCCLRGFFVFIPFFPRIARRIVWCCSCLFSMLSSEYSCIYSAFLQNCLWSPFVFVLFLLCVYFVSVYFLCCFQIVLVFPPFNFYIIRRFVFYCFAYVYTCCFVSEAFRGTYSLMLCLGERIILRL